MDVRIGACVEERVRGAERARGERCVGNERAAEDVQALAPNMTQWCGEKHLNRSV